MQDSKAVPFGMMLIGTLNVIVAGRMGFDVVRGLGSPLIWLAVIASLAGGVGVLCRKLWAWWLMLAVYCMTAVLFMRAGSWTAAVVAVCVIAYISLPITHNAFKGNR
jgi:hypothetical protein